MIDAFYSDSIPFHLATREFLELARSRLDARAGSSRRTSSARVTGPDSRLFRSMLRTYRAVFPTVAIHPVLDAGRPSSVGIRNIILVAGERPRRRRSSCSSAGARCAAARPARPISTRRSGAGSMPDRLDRGRAGADRRLRADRRAVAPVRLAGQRLRDRVPLGRDRLQLLVASSSETSTIVVAVQRGHPAERARVRRGRPPSARSASPARGRAGSACRPAARGRAR